MKFQPDKLYKHILTLVKLEGVDDGLIVSVQLDRWKAELVLSMRSFADGLLRLRSALSEH